MTKHEFLEKLINKKDTWQVTMPIFKEQKETIAITKGICYQGAFKISIEENVLFECFVESLKGIVQPINPFISMSSPVIEYIIDAEVLKENYVYEDRLTCYYLGGRTMIDIKFFVNDNNIVEEQSSLSSKKVLTSKSVKEEEVSLHLSKLTFGMDEIIELNITNETAKARHIVFECKQDFISPNLSEVFLNDHWNQEWYLKKTMIEKLFGNLAFKNEPFKKVVIEAYIDHESHASYLIETAITVYNLYETHKKITSSSMYNRTKISVFRHYIEALVNASSRREASNLLDLIKACLNFNQKDLELRLFYIWLLLEFGHKKEAKSELSLIERYEDYYSSTKEYPMIKIIKGIIYKDASSIGDIFEDIDESSTWMELLAKARHTSSRNSRYNYYKALFDKGVRRSFLFAEVTSLLNQLPIIPEENDELYIVTLKWAFNKKGVSSSWLNKLERHYYQLEKNPYMTSSLAKEMYKSRNSKNFLRLFCQLCIREERYDQVAFDIYKETLQAKVYIQDLENHYMYASWQAKEDIDLDLLKHFTKIRHLDKAIREYIYLSVVKKRASYALLYRRLYNEIVDYLKEVHVLSIELIEVISLMFEELVKEKNDVLLDVMTYKALKTMKDYEVGMDLIGKIFAFTMSENCFFNRVEAGIITNQVIEHIGFEGLYLIYNDKQMLIEIFDEINHNQNYSYKGYFLDNENFAIRNTEEDELIKIYKHIIADDFVDGLITMYSNLQEKNKDIIRASFFYYISRRIVVGFETVKDSFIEELYNYYISQESKAEWLLLALVQGLNSNNVDLTKRIRNLYEEGQKHDIIVPWLSEGVFDENANTLHYLSHPDDDVLIYYRFNENNEFISANMKHIAFGVFIHRIKLFYGEYFEYYIVVKDRDGNEFLPHSDLIINKTITQNSLFIENEYSVEARIDNISLSYELNDDLSAKVFINEQLEFNHRINRLLKV